MDSLVKKLKAANEAYRNTDKLLMTDEEYEESEFYDEDNGYGY